MTLFLDACHSLTELSGESPELVVKPLPPAFSAALNAVRIRKGIVTPPESLSEPEKAPDDDRAKDSMQNATGSMPAASSAAVPRRQGRKPIPMDVVTDNPPESRLVEFLPTPQQIREACLAIQETWTGWERRARAGAFHCGWSVPAGREVRSC